MIPKIILGIQTINKGIDSAVDPKTSDTFIKNTYKNIKAIPAAKLTPIPPLLFLEASVTAIKVRTNEEIGKLVLLYNSTL